MTHVTEICAILALAGTFSTAVQAQDAPAAEQPPAAEAPAPDAAAAGAPAVALPQSMTSDIADIDGKPLGKVAVAFTSSGMAIVDLALTNVPPGVHAVHFHTAGLCEPPFETAKGHLAGDMDHGVMSENGPHPGDMPNITVPETGALTLSYFVPGLTPELMMDADGTAFIIHAGADDYQTQPSGDAGDRLACAVMAAPY